MGSESKISYWIANLWHEFDTLCSETKDMLPQEPIEHVRNQFLTAGDSLKQFYLDLTKDVLPIFKWHSPQENGPTSPKQEENTGLPRDNKSTISTDDGQDGISEAVKSVSRMSYAGPLVKIHIGCVPKERICVFEESSLISIFDSLLRGLTAEEIQNAARAKFAASAQSLAVGSYDDIDESSNICDSEFSTEIQEYKVPDDESSGAMESDAPAKLAALVQSLVVGSCDDIGESSKISDSKFSTEIQENKKTDDESSGAIHSSGKDSALFGPELRAALLELGFIDCDSGSVQSLEFNYSEETEESDNSTVSECSAEEEYETSASFVSIISTGTSSSDSTIFGNELLDRLLDVDLVVEPSNLDRTLSEDEVRAQLFELGFIEASSDHSDSTMFERELQSGLLELGFLDSDSDSDYDSDSDSHFDSGSDSDSASDLDTSDYSSSEETPDCHVTKLGNGVARLSEEQKLDHSIIQETDESAISDNKFAEEQDSSDAEANQENAEVSQDKEWERLDEDFSDSDWEIV